MKDNDNAALLAKAKEQLAADMARRDIGAIIWDNGKAGFHFIPEIALPDGNCLKTVRVTGLYRHADALYAIEEHAHFDMRHFYVPGEEVPPVVVTLTESMADSMIGDVSEAEGFTRLGSVNEWLAIADCYFEALNER